MNPEELQALIDSWKQPPGGAPPMAGGAPPRMPTPGTGSMPEMAGGDGWGPIAPRAPAPMQAPPSPTPPQRPRSLWERIAGVPEGLSDEERRESKRQGLAGLIGGFLMAPLNPGVPFAASRRGAKQGVADVNTLMQKRIDDWGQSRQQDFYKKYEHVNYDDPNVLRNMMMDAATIPGLEKLTTSLTEAYKSTQGGGGSRPTPHSAIDPSTQKPGEYTLDVDGNPKWLGIASNPDATARGPASQLKPYTRPDGSIGYGSWDPTTNKITPTEGGGPPSFAGVAESRSGLFLGMLEEVSPVFDTFSKAPGRIEQAVSDAGLREFTSNEMQELQIAGTMVADAFSRIVSGAALRPEEIDSAWKRFSPMPGDKAGALALKKRLRDRLNAYVKTTAGRAALRQSFEDQPPGAAPGGRPSLEEFGDRP